MACSLPTSVAPIVKKREVPILNKGAEGKLLVPDVKLKVSTCQQQQPRRLKGEQVQRRVNYLRHQGG